MQGARRQGVAGMRRIALGTIVLALALAAAACSGKPPGYFTGVGSFYPARGSNSGSR
jgi:hypothetical protein